MSVARKPRAATIALALNVTNGEYGEMVEAGIPQPAKATRGATENTASVAAMILTAEALITDMPVEAPPRMPCGMDGMGDMGGMM